MWAQWLLCVGDLWLFLRLLCWIKIQPEEGLWRIPRSVILTPVASLDSWLWICAGERPPLSCGTSQVNWGGVLFLRLIIFCTMAHFHASKAESPSVFCDPVWRCRVSHTAPRYSNFVVDCGHLIYDRRSGPPYGWRVAVDGPSILRHNGPLGCYVTHSSITAL